MLALHLQYLEAHAKCGESADHDQRNNVKSEAIAGYHFLRYSVAVAQPFKADLVICRFRQAVKDEEHER